jgi:hypothetical protein
MHPISAYCILWPCMWCTTYWNTQICLCIWSLGLDSFSRLFCGTSSIVAGIRVQPEVSLQPPGHECTLVLIPALQERKAEAVSNSDIEHGAATASKPGGVPLYAYPWRENIWHTWSTQITSHKGQVACLVCLGQIWPWVDAQVALSLITEDFGDEGLWCQVRFSASKFKTFYKGIHKHVMIKIFK